MLTDRVPPHVGGNREVCYCLHVLCGLYGLYNKVAGKKKNCNKDDDFKSGKRRVAEAGGSSDGAHYQWHSDHRKRIMVIKIIDILS